MILLAVDISKLVGEVKEPIEFEQLSGKSIAIDAYNTIYQFLSIIRQPDGAPLVDSKNRVTSHLSGLLYRTTNLIEYGITPVYVFDGIPPVLKQKTLERRASRRAEAEKKWAEAVEKGMAEEARTYAMASTRINKEIVESAKELLRHMGIAYMQAPSEGEAQAAQLVKSGLVYAVSSQDYDSFLFGSDVVIRNLTISGKRRLPMRNIFINVSPERFVLKELLAKFDISLMQLIWMGMLIGTDFNEGIERVGPKTALKIAKEHGSLEKIIGYVRTKYGKEFDADPHQVEKVFTDPEVNKVSSDEFSRIMSQNKLDREKAVKFMCDEHGFSADRVASALDKLEGLSAKKGQKQLF